MDGCGDKHVADVSFVEGKFGKCLPVVDSFVFYPKDKANQIHMQDAGM